MRRLYQLISYLAVFALGIVAGDFGSKRSLDQVIADILQVVVIVFILILLFTVFFNIILNNLKLIRKKWNS